MQIDQKRIEDAVIAEVAQKLISDDDLWNHAKRAFDERVDRLWKDAAEARIRAEIDSVIAQGFERTYQKVNSFGEPNGAKTTIRAELERLIAGYWNETVDKNGKPTSGYGDKLTRAEWLMGKLCADDFAGQMKNHVVNVSGALKDGFRKELNLTVNRLLSEVFHVRSLDDQGVGREVIDPVAKPVGTP